MRSRAPLSWGFREPVLSWPERSTRSPPKAAQKQASPEARSPNRGLIITLLVSLGLHIAAVTAALLLLHAAVPVVDTAEKPTEVELVMEEHKGGLHPTTAPAPAPPAPAPSPARTPAQKAPEPSAAKVTSPPIQGPKQAQPDGSEPMTAPTKETSVTPAEAEPPVPDAKADPGKAPVQEASADPIKTPEQEPKPEQQPAPPTAQPAPIISLEGTDSPSDARAFGDQIIPAKPDAVFHNRPPEYPREAAVAGQRGTVVVVIHVSPAGMAVGADVVRSSGYVLLDQAAQQAVLRWRFLPAVKDGQPVASNMALMFNFVAD
jgi:protein TonB